MDLSLKLSVDEVNGVLAGLAELPAKHSFDLINKVKSQAELQLAPLVHESPLPEIQPELLVEG